MNRRPLRMQHESAVRWGRQRTRMLVLRDKQRWVAVVWAARCIEEELPAGGQRLSQLQLVGRAQAVGQGRGRCCSAFIASSVPLEQLHVRRWAGQVPLHAPRAVVQHGLEELCGVCL